MFCAKCGRKLSSKDELCKNCGVSTEIADRCGGFFGLIDEEPAKRAAAAPAATVAPKISNQELERYHKHMKEEVMEEMRQKALIVVSALCAVLLIVVIILAISLLGEEPVARTEINAQDIVESIEEINNAADAAKSESSEEEKENNQGFENVVKDQIKADICACEFEYVTLDEAAQTYTQSRAVRIEPSTNGTEHTHSIICLECNKPVNGKEPCNFVEGATACSVCGVEHDYKYVASMPEMEGNGKMHELECAVCGEEKKEECVFDHEKCKLSMCTNKCDHKEIEGIKSADGKHDEVCEACSKTVVKGADDPEDGACPGCGYTPGE